MTIDKAIRYLERLPSTLGVPLTDEEKDALKLGVEGLKRIQKLRTYEYFGYDSSLEGETE